MGVAAADFDNDGAQDLLRHRPSARAGCSGTPATAASPT